MVKILLMLTMKPIVMLVPRVSVSYKVSTIVKLVLVSYDAILTRRLAKIEGAQTLIASGVWALDPNTVCRPSPDLTDVRTGVSAAM